MTTCFEVEDNWQRFGYKRTPRNKTFSGRFDVRDNGDKFEIWNLKVFERYRQKGYATQMLLEFLSQFNTSKPLSLYVYKTNTIAIHLYEKVGFTIIGDCYFNTSAYEMQFVKE